MNGEIGARPEGWRRSVPFRGLAGAALAVALAAAATPAWAEEGGAAPILTLEAGFDFAAGDPATAYDAASGSWLADGSSRWYTSETARVGLTARYGNRLVLDAELEAPFNRSDSYVSADRVLRELSVEWDAGDYLVLTAGKQNLKWGTARVYSSVDALSPALDPLDPDQTDRGVTGLRFDAIPTWWFSVAGVALPASILDRSTAGLRAEILAGETDLSLGAVRSVDAEGNETPAVFADVARFFDRWGLYAEAQAKSPKGLADAGDWNLAATLGAEADVPAWLNGTIVFLGEWRWRQDDPGLGDELDGKAEHALYAGVSGIPLARRVNLRAYALGVPGAGQTLLGAKVSWSPEQSLSTYLGYEYLDARADGDGVLLPYLTTGRHRVTAGVTAWY